MTVAPSTFSLQRTVEWGQCDPAGIVFFPRYLEMLDAALAGLFHAATGLTKPELLRTHAVIGFPVVHVDAAFLQPCGFGDLIRIDSTIAGLGRTSFLARHEIWRGDILAVRALLRRVWAEADPAGGIRGKPFPAQVAGPFLTPQSP